MKTIQLYLWVCCICWSLASYSQETQQVTTMQYFFNTDPGVGVPGNGAIIPVTPTGDLNQNFNLALPGSLGQGFHQLCVRVKDEYGRWSQTERRLFYITDLVSGTRNIEAYQYFFDSDPGIGFSGNGAIVSVPNTTNLNTTIAITLPGSLGHGFHQLYFRTKDDMGRWSMAERRMFYLTDLVTGTRNINQYQYFFDTDPGPGIAGNGAVVPVSSTSAFNTTLAIQLPGNLNNGFHQFYLRFRDDMGRWSIVEHRLFYITDIVSDTRNIIAYQYFYDADPGEGVVGNGGIYPLTSTSNYSNTINISLPGSLSPGIHNLYLRMKDDLGRWSIAERRMFYISDTAGDVHDITSMEYYFDNDPGKGNANPYPVVTTTDFNQTIDLGVPCLSTGAHYLYLRAKDTYNRWSIIARDTFTISSGIEPSVVTPAGPNSICNGGMIILSTTPVPGVSYQWVESGIPIPGATSPSFTVTSGGSYALRTICGSFVLSNTVIVNETPLITFFADADQDGYGNADITLADCVQPSGYVSNDDDCDDTNASIHPNATENCNMLDDDCDGLVDEGVLLTFYADADNDGYGNPNISQFACSAPAGYVTNGDDCNDASSVIHPGATETCNLIDDDCDGLVDEGVQTIFYADADNDGFGNPASTVLACNAPQGYVSNNTDCDDALYFVHPGALEVCNGLDDDCDNMIDEGFTQSIAATSIASSHGNSFCEGDTTTLTVVGGTLGTGASWKWFEGGCGSGSAIGTGASLFLNLPGGIHTFYVRAEGTCNSSPCVFYTINVLTEPVSLFCPTEIYANNTVSLCSGSPSYSVIFSGNPAPVLTYTQSGATSGSGSGTGTGSVVNVGETWIEVIAQNVCGTAQCEFTLSLADNETPVFSNCPGDIQSDIEDGQWGAHVSWTEPSANDNCEIDQVVSTHQPGDFFVVGQTTVTYTATDIHGHAVTCSFDVNVVPPQVTGPVNVSIFANDIQFSDPTPDPGSSINVFATVHNTSNTDAGTFVCRLLDQYEEEYANDIIITDLDANEDTTITWVITTPVDPAFVPIQVTVDYPDDLEESNELDNQAVRPYLNGDFNFGGRIVVVPNAISTVVAGSTISICGSAYYDDTAVPLEDSSVAGAQVTIHILETGQVLQGTTNSAGAFCVPYITPNTAGLYHYNAEVTDFTLTGDTTGVFTLTDPVIICPKDLALTMELSGTFLCDNRYHIAQGQTLTGSIRVYNSCASVTQPTTLYVALPDGTPVPGPFTIPALSPGETYDVTLPGMTFNTLGWTYISATVDYYNVVTEDNESNNSRLINIQVHPPLPDLEPQPGTISTTFECVPGFISFIIHNNGGAPTGDFETTLEIYHGAILETTLTQVVTSISGLCDQVISFPVDPVFAGLYNFHLICDSQGVVNELSEVNNQLNMAYLFEACERDLVMDGTCGSIDVKPANPQYPGTITLYAKVLNKGTLAVTSPFNVSFNVAGDVYSVTVSTPISVGGVKDVSISVPTPPHGNNTLIITADWNDDIPELNEFNNAVTESLCWDFAITNTTCAGDNYIRPTQFICQPVTFRAGLFNIGLYEASSLQTKFEVQGPGLPPTGVNLGTVTTFLDHTCNCPVEVALPNPFTFPQLGTYTITVTSDPDNQYTECQEGNNQVTVTVQVVESPDYAVYSQFIAPSDINPDLNEPISFNLTYANEGCTGLTPMELWIEMDNTPLDSLTASATVSGAFNTYAMTQTWSSGLPGLHVARSVIDHDHLISETNELNNEATRGIIVGDAPDFNITALAVSDDTPQTGQTINVNVTVLNEGRATADALLRVYLLSDDHQEMLVAEYDIHLISQADVLKSFACFIPGVVTGMIARVTDPDPQEYDYTDNERSITLNAMSLSVIETDVACAELDLGSLQAVIDGGVPPYFVQWSNGFTGPVVNVSSGTYSVTVTDAAGHMRTALDTIMDLEIPVTWYEDQDGDGYGNPDVSDYTCTPPTGFVGTGTDCNDSLATAYPGAVELADGKDNDCDGLIDEGLNTLNVNAGDCEMVYYGYMPDECHTLSVSATGGAAPYTYSWSTGATTSSTNVCPQVTTIYSVTVTDNNGFTAEDNVTVQVIDIRCGNNNNKVVVCHIPPGNPENMQIICIAPSAVQAHLDHGCYVGICDATDPCGEPVQSSMINPFIENVSEGNEQSILAKPGSDPDVPFEVSLLPNPADQSFTIEINGMKESVDMILYDVNGKVLLHRQYEKDLIEVETNEWVDGVYFIQLRLADHVMVKELIILHRS